MSETNFDIIQKAAHYNQSPVECIIIIRDYSFNIGNAFKYIFRKDFKGNEVQDIKKSIYYIQDEINKRKKYSVLHRIPNIFKYFGYKKRIKLIEKVSDSIDNDLIALSFILLNRADYFQFDVFFLESVKGLLEELIME